jgi:O-antigen/teichoic acid export membrane protein
VSDHPVIPSDSEPHSDSHTTFFRQSGWLVVATVSGGVFMMATQVVANRWMSPTEYGVWVTLLRVYLLMSIPTTGLQTVFAQQTAAAVTDRQHRELARTVRATLQATFVIWLGIALVAFAGQRQWMGQLKIANPAALWVTVLIGLASLWSPLVRGVLQGRQNFLGLGWVLILDGVGRFAAIVVILQLGGQAAGGMTGALIGQGASLLVGLGLIGRLLRERGEPVTWRPWLRRVVPLTLGVGSVLFLSNADVIFIQSVFAADKAQTAACGYMPAAIIGLALVTFTMPLAAVMFPKVVRSAALAQDTRALRLALGATALLGGLGALACTVLPWLPLRIIYFSRPEYWVAAPLVPWFAWSLLPLILANVLLGNLLARERFAVVPWSVLVAVGYGLALAALKPRLPALPELVAFRTVIQTLGVCSLCLLGVAAAFTWAERARVGAGARGA